MPKRIFAVTNIKVGSGANEYWPAGSVIARGGALTDQQLVELHEAGAVEIRTVDEDTAPDGEAIDAVVSSSTDDPAPEAVEPEAPTKDSDPKNK